MYPYHNFQRVIDSITVEVRAWASKYIPLFYVEVITYPCPNSDTGLTYVWMNNSEWITQSAQSKYYQWW